jgi:hypothetical protein
MVIRGSKRAPTRRLINLPVENLQNQTLSALLSALTVRWGSIEDGKHSAAMVFVV